MKIYDKARWHIDGGENKDEVLKKFSLFFHYLKKNNMLTDEGNEIFDIGFDPSISLHERMVNTEGKEFLDANYDLLLPPSATELEEKLSLL